MNNQILLIILTLLSGALIPVQASTNAAMSKTIGNPVITALIVFIVGLLSVSVYVLVSKTPMPALSQFKNVPLYGFAGGLIVAFYVIVITFVTPRLGVAAAIGLIITGQVIAALIIDHFGLFSAAVKTIDLKRFAGGLCMLAGIYLVMKK
ncbi:MAG: DMT family transporter [Bacteroidota bacterium]